MTPLRILVLTSSTGGGHDARAAAFVRWIKRLHGWSIDVRVESMLEDSSAINRFGVRFYNFIQKHAPWLHHPYYLLIELLAFVNRRGVGLGRRYYRQVLENFQPHLVFSVHDCLNRGYFPEARAQLGAKNVRCATYCSEFSGGYGYSQNWIEPSVDLYISRTQTAADYAVKLGMPRERIVVRGHLMDPRIYEDVLDAAKRRRYRVENLGLDPDKFTVFLATGGVGANNHLALLPALLRYADTHQVIIVCGRNHKAFVRVNEWRKAHPQLRCHLEGYCSTMHLLVQASDVIVTRGGTTTCAKALYYRTPIILNGFGGVMPQERLTAKFFTQDRASVVISRVEDFEALLARWHAAPAEFETMRQRFIGLRYDDDPKVVLGELVGLARDAAAGTGEEISEPVV
ncbi:MAG: glycosyltransferase [Opitutaceae bacterium]|nr:glycosyltransferase [Opitutaceae bacterium]